MAEDVKVESDVIYRDAQTHLVGVLIADGNTDNRVFELVTSEDFEEPNLQLMFEAIVNIARRDEKVSATSVAKELEDRGELNTVGGIKELYRLRRDGYNWSLESPAQAFAAIVKEHAAKSQARRLLAETQEIFKPDSGVPAVDGISVLQSELNNSLFRLSDESTTTSLADDMDAYDELLKERAVIAAANEDGSAGLQGIPCLLPTLNRYTTGWLPGQLITLGARTGVGKSVFAVNSAVAAAQAGKSVLFFSLEMDINEIKDRMIASMTGIPMNSFKQGRLTETEEETYRRFRPEISDMKITVDVDPNVTVDSIRARALQRAQSPEGLDFIIVDYLQLIKPVGRFSSRQEAVADVSRNMKLLAKQLQVPVMVLVQVNRQSNDDENETPQLHQIRESGAIAQDSDIVILLHRDANTDDTTPHTIVILAKNRNGEANKSIRCHSNLECSLFREAKTSKDASESLTDDDLDALDGGGADLSFDDEDLDLGDELDGDEGDFDGELDWEDED